MPPVPRPPSAPWSPRRVLFRLAVFLAAGYVVVVLVLLALEDRLIFHPVPAWQRWLELPSTLAVQDISLGTKSGIPIHARWCPCPGARGAILVCHSRAGNLSLDFRPEALAQWHREVGESLLLFDYPGYGRSAGSPSEAGCYEA